MGGLTDQLRAFLDAHRVGVLGTVAEDGKPRQSVVYYARDGNRLLISTLSKRLKARDVGRTAWASLSVRGEEQPYPSATFFGAGGDPDQGHRSADRPDHAPHRGYGGAAGTPER